MKNYGDLGGCYPPRPTASTDNTLVDLQNSSKDSQPHSLIVNLFYQGHSLRSGGGKAKNGVLLPLGSRRSPIFFFFPPMRSLVPGYQGQLIRTILKSSSRLFKTRNHVRSRLDKDILFVYPLSFTSPPLP